MSLVLDSRLDARLGWGGEAAGRAWALRDDAGLRAALARLPTLAKPLPPTTGLHPDAGAAELALPALPSAALLSGVLDEALQGLPGLPAAKAEGLLATAWALATGSQGPVSIPHPFPSPQM